MDVHESRPFSKPIREATGPGIPASLKGPQPAAAPMDGDADVAPAGRVRENRQRLGMGDSMQIKSGVILVFFRNEK